MTDVVTDHIAAQPRPIWIGCGSSGGTLYTDMADRLFGAPGRWQIKECRNTACGSFDWTRCVCQLTSASPTVTTTLTIQPQTQPASDSCAS